MGWVPQERPNESSRLAVALIVLRAVSWRFARVVSLYNLCIDVLLVPRDGLELSAGEHRRLVREIGGVRVRALAIRQDRVGTRLLIAELHGENPAVGAGRLELAVRRLAIRQYADATEIARAAADRDVHVPAANAVDVAPRDVERAVVLLREI